MCVCLSVCQEGQSIKISQVCEPVIIAEIVTDTQEQAGWASVFRDSITALIPFSLCVIKCLTGWEPFQSLMVPREQEEL